jgi:hypothetical protein
LKIATNFTSFKRAQKLHDAFKIVTGLALASGQGEYQCPNSAAALLLRRGEGAAETRAPFLWQRRLRDALKIAAKGLRADDNKLRDAFEIAAK